MKRTFVRAASIEELLALKGRRITLKQLLDQGVVPTFGGGAPDDDPPVEDEPVEDEPVEDAPVDAPDPDDEVDDPDSVEFVRIPRAQFEQAQAEARQQAARAKKAEKEAKDRKEREAAEQGRFRELSDGYKAERDEALERANSVQTEMLNLIRSRDVEKAAKRLGFVDPDDAWLHIQRSGLTDEMWKDPNVVQKALKKILSEKPHLRGTGRPSGAPRPSGGGGGLTLAEVARMTPAQVNSQWDAVQAAMARGE